jgi:hypothetical protein
MRRISLDEQSKETAVRDGNAAQRLSVDSESSSDSDSDDSWSSDEDDRLFRLRFMPTLPSEDHKTAKEVCDGRLPTAVRASTFRRPAVLGLAHPEGKREPKRRVWDEVAELRLECKQMPYSRVRVEVYSNVLRVKAETLAQEREKIATSSTPAAELILQNKASLRRAGEVVNLFKKVLRSLLVRTRSQCLAS